jgi:membrane-bound serine protease (ClpP class)
MLTLMRRLLVALGILLGLLLPAGAVAGPARHVDVLRLVGTINPVSANLVLAALRRAEADGAAAFVLELDTPGGGLESMRAIAQAFLASPVATIVYVAPAGARAASAGTFLAYAARYAAMAPGTEIGAAHPVAAGGAAGSVEDAKVTNDAVAMITAWAERNGRNADWAAAAVRQAAALPAEAALQQHVVDAVAPTLAGVLQDLGLGPAEVRELPVPVWTRLLMALADPDVAYLLLTLGFWAVVAEFVHPTVVVGALGALAALLGLLGMQMLSAAAAGVGLLLLGLGLLVADVKVPTHGVLTAAGLAAFVTGSLLLFPPLGGFGLAPWVVALASALCAAFGLAVAFGLRQRPARVLGPAARDLLGRRARVVTAVRPRGDGPPGLVRVGGSYWRAVSLDGEHGPETEVEVAGLDGLTLEVWTPRGPA